MFSDSTKWQSDVHDNGENVPKSIRSSPAKVGLFKNVCERRRRSHFNFAIATATSAQIVSKLKFFINLQESRCLFKNNYHL